MTESTWYQSLAEALKRVFDRIVEFLPNLLGSLLLILIGWLLARLLGALGRRLCIYALTRLGSTSSFDSGLETQAKYRALPVVVGGFVFWIVLLFFIAAGIEALGLRAVSDLFGSATTYLPRVLLATIILFTGVLAGDLAYRATARTASKAGVVYADSLGRSAQVFLITLAAIIAVDQLGIDSMALLITLAIVVGSIFLATALAFGIGAGVTVSNILAAHYVSKSYRAGQTIRIGDLEGRIAEISRTAVVIETAEGRVQVPARRFAEDVSVLIGKGD